MDNLNKDAVSSMREALNTHTWLMAEVAGVAVGYAYAHPFASRPAYRWACETSIYLAGEHRGRGVGRLLYTALLQRLVARGYRTALAGIALPNEASIALHTGLGYAPAGVYRRVGWKLGAWRDVAWYQRATGEYPANWHASFGLVANRH